MSTAPPAVLSLARRLIAIESARPESQREAAGVVRVCDRLRVSLARLAGIAGFRSLLSRALALAKADTASLSSVRVRDDGSLEGFDAAGNGQSAGEDGGAALVAHLLGLLVTFIGESLMRQLVQGAWPDVDVDERNGPAGGQP